MEAYRTVNAYELLTGFTVDFEGIVWVSTAVEHLLLGLGKAGGLFLDLGKADYFVIGEFLPELVDFNAFRTDKLATVTAETGSCCLLASFAWRLLWLFDLLKGVSDVKEIVNVEGGL